MSSDFTFGEKITRFIVNTGDVDAINNWMKFLDYLENPPSVPETRKVIYVCPNCRTYIDPEKHHIPCVSNLEKQSYLQGRWITMYCKKCTDKLHRMKIIDRRFMGLVRLKETK